MDVRTTDGSVIKISASSEQDLAKSLSVEMVQNMYKVRKSFLIFNQDDIFYNIFLLLG